MRIVEDPLNRDTIQAVTQLIVERFEPEQVILFGSCARGEEPTKTATWTSWSSCGTTTNRAARATPSASQSPSVSCCRWTS